MSAASQVRSEIQYFPADGGDIRTHPPRRYDMRSPATAGAGGSVAATIIRDGRQAVDTGLEKSGFELIQRSTSVSNFLD
ncbi:uncharacterized protein METZ01_LOCUS282415, partial [marine metagenome]